MRDEAPKPAGNDAFEASMAMVNAQPRVFASGVIQVIVRRQMAAPETPKRGGIPRPS